MCKSLLLRFIHSDQVRTANPALSHGPSRPTLHLRNGRIVVETQLTFWPMAEARPLRAVLGLARLRCVPRSPGVYWLVGPSPAGLVTVLYIGRTVNLRRRLADYRNLRLADAPPALARVLPRVREVHWQACPDLYAAGLLETDLIQRYRPRGNHVGTHPNSRWFAGMIRDRHRLKLLRRSRPEGTGSWFGAFRRRSAFGALVRCLRLTLHGPDVAWPVGWWEGSGPAEAEFDFPPGRRGEAAAAAWMELLGAYWAGESDALVHRLREQCEQAAPSGTPWHTLCARDLAAVAAFYSHVSRPLCELRRRFGITDPCLPAAKTEQLLALRRLTAEQIRRWSRR